MVFLFAGHLDYCSDYLPISPEKRDYYTVIISNFPVCFCEKILQKISLALARENTTKNISLAQMREKTHLKCFRSRLRAKKPP